MEILPTTLSAKVICLYLLTVLVLFQNHAWQLRAYWVAKSVFLVTYNPTLQMTKSHSCCGTLIPITSISSVWSDKSQSLETLSFQATDFVISNGVLNKSYIWAWQFYANIACNMTSQVTLNRRFYFHVKESIWSRDKKWSNELTTRVCSLARVD